MDKEFKYKCNLVLEKNRLVTFKNWKIADSKPCSAVKMAEAGFYCTGDDDSDAVKCFLCGKELDGWDENDDPWKEHISHSLICEFAKLQQRECSLNQEQFLKFNAMMISNIVMKTQEEIKQEKIKLFTREIAKMKRRFNK